MIEIGTSNHLHLIKAPEKIFATKVFGLQCNKKPNQRS